MKEATKDLQEIGDEPRPSGKRSEVAELAACQSEGIAGLPVLCAVRQGVPDGRAGVRYACCKANKGAAGVDGQTFEDIEETYGLERWLGELQEELKDKSYCPSAVRRVWIPKPDGKQRPLGVPTIKDRVAQMAAVVVLEAIFEADLLPEQYAYRPERSALDAVSHVQKLLMSGHGQVVDADLSGYFDSIPTPSFSNRWPGASATVR